MDIAKVLILSGISLVVLGLLFSIGFGRLPGDIMINRGNATFYFPIVSMILLSIIASIILRIFFR